MTWLVVLEFLLGAVRDPPLWLGLAHAALGLGLVALSAANSRSIAATRVPGRVKRTARSNILLASLAASIGFLLYFDVGAGREIVGGVTVWGSLLVAHVFFAVGVLAEAAAIGISYDMWEESEFQVETAPGEIPAMAQPSASGPAKRRPGAG